MAWESPSQCITHFRSHLVCIQDICFRLATSIRFSQLHLVENRGPICIGRNVCVLYEGHEQEAVLNQI